MMKIKIGDLVYPTGGAQRWFSSQRWLPILLCTGITNDLSELVVFFMFPWGETGRTSYAELQPL